VTALLALWFARSRSIGYLVQLLHFAHREALSCAFPCLLFATLAVSKVIHVPYLHRYDLILLVCLLIQLGMYLTRLETADELKVIAVFHLLGLALELYKVRAGSWAYPEDAWSKLGGVPLYSGFMYASVASYMCQAWRRLALRLTGWPSGWLAVPFAVAVYLNFFTHHYLPDIRWWLVALMLVIFRRTRVRFSLPGATYALPLTLGFFLIGLFVWLAENIATFFDAWQYPYQSQGWSLVHLSKISSWFLLVVVSFVAVAQLKHVKARRRPYLSRREHRGHC
jgi:uncharacterized membrane protein YoaT (DUF817 family)